MRAGVVPLALYPIRGERAAGQHENQMLRFLYRSEDLWSDILSAFDILQVAPGRQTL